MLGRLHSRVWLYCSLWSCLSLNNLFQPAACHYQLSSLLDARLLLDNLKKNNARHSEIKEYLLHNLIALLDKLNGRALVSLQSEDLLPPVRHLSDN